MKNDLDSRISAYLRLAELCGTGDEKKKKFYMVQVEKLLEVPAIDEPMDEKLIRQLTTNWLNEMWTYYKAQNCDDSEIKYIVANTFSGSDSALIDYIYSKYNGTLQYGLVKDIAYDEMMKCPARSGYGVIWE